jgi:hypothetical protein
MHHFPGNCKDRFHQLKMNHYVVWHVSMRNVRRNTTYDHVHQNFTPTTHRIVNWSQFSTVDYSIAINMKKTISVIHSYILYICKCVGDFACRYEYMIDR